MGVRKRFPAVAGMYYEARPEALRARIEWAFRHRVGPGELPRPSPVRRRESVGFLVPHAGYMFSGPVAAHAYYRMALEGKAETYVIVGPNHTGLGTLVSVYPRGVWVTPLGEVEVDDELARAIVEASSYADADEKAHLYEHSVEVQLPFLQYLFNARFRIVAIAMWDQSPEAARDLAYAIKGAAERLGRDVTLISTSDLTHYEPHETAVEKDRSVLEAMKTMDPEAVARAVAENDVSMCGVGPVMTLLYYAKLVGAKHVEILKYATTGDVTGDRSSVVGYAAVRVY